MKIGLVLLVTAIMLTLPSGVFAGTTYYSSWSSFNSAAGSGLAAESFEDDWSPAVASYDFGDFTVTESDGLNYVAQAFNFSATVTGFMITDGDGAVWYDDNSEGGLDSVLTFDFDNTVFAFGIDVSSNDATTFTVGGDLSTTLSVNAKTPTFFGFITTTGVDSISFEASGGSDYIGFDNAQYTMVPLPSSALLGAGFLAALALTRVLRRRRTA